MLSPSPSPDPTSTGEGTPLHTSHATEVYHPSLNHLHLWLTTAISTAAPSFFKRDSPGGSMRRGQRTFRPDNKEDRHNCF